MLAHLPFQERRSLSKKDYSNLGSDCIDTLWNCGFLSACCALWKYSASPCCWGIVFLSIVVWRPLSALLTSFVAYLVCEYSATMKRFSRVVAAHSAKPVCHQASGTLEKQKQKQNPERQQPYITEAVVETMDNYTGQIWTKQHRLQFLIYSQALPGISGGEICYLKELHR